MSPLYVTPLTVTSTFKVGLFDINGSSYFKLPLIVLSLSDILSAAKEMISAVGIAVFISIRAESVPYLLLIIISITYVSGAKSWVSFARRVYVHIFVDVLIVNVEPSEYSHARLSP